MRRRNRQKRSAPGLDGPGHLDGVVMVAPQSNHEMFRAISPTIIAATIAIPIQSLMFLLHRGRWASRVNFLGSI